MMTYATWSISWFMFLVTACGEKDREIQFESEVLEEQAQLHAYIMDYWGKDTFNINSIVETDNNKIYRLKSERLLDRTKEAFTYYIDSSIDSGRSWSSAQKVLREDYGMQLFVARSGNPKYLVGNSRVLVAESGIRFKELPLNLSQYEGFDHFQYNNETNTLILLTASMSTENMYRISGDRIKKVTLPKEYESTFNNYKLYYGDTLFAFSGSDFSNRALLKIDSSGNLVDRIPFSFAGNNQEQLFLVNEGNYYYYGPYEKDRIRRMVSVIKFSDYGKSHRMVDSFMQVTSFNYYKDDSILLARKDTEEGSVFSLSHNLGKNWISFSDTAFYSNNKRVVFPIFSFPRNYQDKLFFIALDTSKSGYSHLFRLRKKNYQSFSTLKSYSIAESPDKIKVKVHLRKGNQKKAQINLLLFGADTFNYKINKKFLAKFKQSNHDENQWEASFNPDVINIVPGKRYKLELYFSDYTKENHYNFPVLTFLSFSPSKNKPLLIILSLLFGIFIILISLFYFAPYSIYTLYTKLAFLRNLANSDLTGRFGIVFKLLDTFTIIPLFVHQPRVYDAWVKKNKEKLLWGFRQEPVYKSHSRLIRKEETESAADNTYELNYTPLPFSVQEKTGMQREPDPKVVGEFFQRARLCLEIVGMGGLGKTTLALKIGEWASNSLNIQHFQSHLWLPILIAEETSDIFGVVTRKINAMTNSVSEKDFLKGLLRKQRLLIIVDALSEKSAKMQQHVERIYENVPANALLLTTRYEINIEGVEKINFYPRAMNSSKVLDYIVAYFIDTEIEILKSKLNSSKLLTEILKRFFVGEKEIPILPILINQILEKLRTFAIKNPGTSLEGVFAQVPATIPDVFSDYLIRVNSKEGTSAISDSAMLYYAEVIAEICLGDNLLPQQVPLNEIEMGLSRENIPNSTSIVKVLIHNGVLTDDRNANDYFIGFAFDPIAEYLTAIRKAKRCGNDYHSWKQLYQFVDKQNAQSFRAILEIVHISYAAHYKWVPFNKLTLS